MLAVGSHLSQWQPTTFGLQVQTTSHCPVVRLQSVALLPSTLQGHLTQPEPFANTTWPSEQMLHCRSTRFTWHGHWPLESFMQVWDVEPGMAQSQAEKRINTQLNNAKNEHIRLAKCIRLARFRDHISSLLTCGCFINSGIWQHILLEVSTIMFSFFCQGCQLSCSSVKVVSHHVHLPSRVVSHHVLLLSGLSPIMLFFCQGCQPSCSSSVRIVNQPLQATSFHWLCVQKVSSLFCHKLQKIWVQVFVRHWKTKCYSRLLHTAKPHVWTGVSSFQKLSKLLVFSLCCSVVLSFGVKVANTMLQW